MRSWFVHRWVAWLLFLIFIMCLLKMLVSPGTTEQTCPGEEQAASNLHQLCSAYERGLLLGNLCPSICDANTFTLEQCTSHGSAGLNPASIVGTLGRRRIILKSEFADRQDFDSIVMKNDAYETLPSENVFEEIVKDTIKLELNIDEHAIRVVDTWWGLPFKSYMKSRQEQTAAMQSVWSLMQQAQFVMTRYLQSSPYVATLHGTCGHYYAVDFIPRESRYMANATASPVPRHDVIEAPWPQRVILAMNLLEFVRALDEEYHEQLHVCDMRGDNLMMNINTGVKLVSLDALMFNEKFDYLLTHRECKSDSDCSLLDCEAHCDAVEEQCIGGRANTNLQVLCRRILLDHQYNRYKGLLSNLPEELAIALRPLLLRCGALSRRFSNSNNILNTYNLNRDIYNLLAKHLYPALDRSNDVEMD